MAGQLTGGRQDGPAPVAAADGRRPETSRSSLLSRAGMLLGTSLDKGRTLAAIAELLVPSFADQCVVDLLDDTGTLRRAVAVRVDHARQRRVSAPGPADRRVAYPNEHPCAIALRTGRPALAHSSALGPLSPPPVQPVAPNVPRPGASAVRPILVDATSVIAVPLLGPRGIKGVLAVATDTSESRFDHDDVELVEEVAARAGFALENAALYESMRSLALALQHSLLPAHMPTIDGVSVQVGYNPGDESDVGGDLYDVMELSSGRIGIAIGDVQGRGAHAAAVMGQLRAALRAYAVLDMEPAQVLKHLDELVQGLNEALLVTCLYAVYDPFTRQCVLSNAGHPPPLLAGADGCFPMEVPPDVPLGVGGESFNDHAFTVAPGDTIVLYTDGVVERRGQSVDEGVRALCSALEAAGPGASPAVLCRATLRSAAEPADDDQAVLAMRTDVESLPMWRIELPADPVSPSNARAHARAMLEQWSIKDVAETVELLVSELVTNALRHAAAPAPNPLAAALAAADDEDDEPAIDLAELERALLSPVPPDGLYETAMLDGAVAAMQTNRRIEVVMRLGRSMLWVEVHDQDVRTPRIRSATATDEGGRGLFLVEQLSRRWGVRTTEIGKAVWFQLALEG